MRTATEVASPKKCIVFFIPVQRGRDKIHCGAFAFVVTCRGGIAFRINARFVRMHALHQHPGAPSGLPR
jgi:hypothetical protein